MTCKHNWVEFKDPSLETKIALYVFHCTRCMAVCFSDLTKGENHGS